MMSDVHLQENCRFEERESWEKVVRSNRFSGREKTLPHEWKSRREEGALSGGVGGVDWGSEGGNSQGKREDHQKGGKIGKGCLTGKKALTYRGNRKEKT